MSNVIIVKNSSKVKKNGLSILKPSDTKRFGGVSIMYDKA